MFNKLKMTVINSSKSTHNWDCKAEESLVSDDNSRVKKKKNEKEKKKVRVTLTKHVVNGHCLSLIIFMLNKCLLCYHKPSTNRGVAVHTIRGVVLGSS